MRDLFYLQGGDILLETISSNVTEDLITLEFQRSDGTLVTQLIDFKNVIVLQAQRSHKNEERVFYDLFP